ncbi:MAG TPA: Ig-like domain-containing protein, partial [Nitrospiria bacterium]|nr:Ig-like domain-containing protein [Nitrospiria bacterium]
MARKAFAAGVVGLALILLIVSTPRALLELLIADSVRGQVDYTHNTKNFVDGHGLNNPYRVAIDQSQSPNRVYVADYYNHRVLGWADASSFQNGDPATLVIGQPDLYSYACDNGGVTASSLCYPMGIAVDDLGNLYVADTGNSRVLEYDNPFTTDTVADVVLGQPNFTSNLVNNGGVSASSLWISSGWGGVAVDGVGNVYVADSLNNRVLIYNAPLSSGAAASVVIGQKNFSSNSPNDGGATVPSAASLRTPTGVAVDTGGNLYVADSANHRVLEYAPSFSTHMSAHMVFGQAGFTTHTTNADNAASANSLRSPYDVAVDGSGNLYVADNGNCRVVEYDTPVSLGTTADRVFGQNGSFATTGCVAANVTAGSLSNVPGVAVDAAGDLYVADLNNHRVLEYDTPLSSDTIADRVLGQIDLTHNAVNFIDAIGLSSPSGTAVDNSVSPPRLYVADYDNSRVLAWADATSFTNGAPADLVIGQPDFYSGKVNAGAAAPSAATLANPRAVAVDAAGNLYVADTSNSRVVEFDSPFTTDTTADRVFGQPDFVSAGLNNGGVSASSLFNPNGVAVDAAGNLFVSDFGNSRVLRYSAPLTSGEAANLVIGQTNFSSTGCNASGLSAGSLCNPSGVVVDAAGNLFVGDTTNNRVLAYTAPLSSSASAVLIIGQPNGSSSTCNNGGVSATSLCAPRAVAVDQYNNLYVADYNNSRVLLYTTPLTTDTVADQVFGQSGVFSLASCNLGVSLPNDTSLCNPYGVGVSPIGDLYVADTINHRVVYFEANRPPVSDDQSVTTPEDTPVVITLTASDVDSSTLNFYIVSQPAYGTVSTTPTNVNCVPNGKGADCTAQVTYTPYPNYDVPESFTFKTNDGLVDSNIATVSITVTPVNDPPTVVAPTSPITTLEDTPVVITLTGADIDSPTLTFNAVTPPTWGTLSAFTTTCTPNVTLAGNGSNCTTQVTFTPTLNYNGTDSFTFVANDGELNSTVATVNLSITAVNDPPAAADQAVTVSKNNVKLITLSSSDVDSPSLTFSVATLPTNGIVSLISGTTTCTSNVTYAGNGSTCTAQATYTPNTNYTGPDSFTFMTNDTALNSAPATVTLTVVNDPPTVTSQSVTTAEDTPITITLTGSDPNGDTLTFSIVTPPTQGTLGPITPVSATSANVTYTPNLNYNGGDSFVFKANDGTVDSLPGTMTLSISPVNDAPVALAQNVTTPEDSAVLITLSAFDVDSPALTFSLATPPAHGTLSAITGTSCTSNVTLAGDGSTCTAQATYTPTLYYRGTDSFTYTANDGALNATPVTVTLTMTPVNHPPVAVNDTATVAKNSAGNVIDVLANDTDVDPDILGVASVAAPANGTAMVTADVAPLRDLTGSTTGLLGPAGIYVDTVNDEIGVANPTNNSVTIYSRTAAGDVAPVRTLTGPTTGLNNPAGLYVDTVNNEIGVVNSAGNSVTVYSRTATGDMAPLRTLSGANTGLSGPTGIYVDTVNNEIGVANGAANSVTVYSRTATGNTGPLRTISGAGTGLSNPTGLYVDMVNDEIGVVNGGADSVTIFSRTATGNAAPVRTLTGPTTGLNTPIGIYVDAVNDEIGVTNSGTDSVMFYSRTATGDVAPLRSLTGSNTGLNNPA